MFNFYENPLFSHTEKYDNHEEAVGQVPANT